MKYRLILFILSLSLFTGTDATAQKMLSVEDAIAATLKNNYDILLLRNDSSSYALDKAYARAAFLPRLKIGRAHV